VRRPSEASAPEPGPPAPEPPRRAVAVWLVVGVVAISTSPILVRVADLPALALAFWRCLAGALLLAPFALRGRAGRRAGPLERREVARLVAAGLFLAVHFALWNASLALTSVAASTTLVSCAPLFVGLGARFVGETTSRRAWFGIVLAVAGAVIIGLGDAIEGSVGGVRPEGSGEPQGGAPVDRGACCPTGRSAALLGDGMAFAGAAAMAAYLLLGRVARRRLPVSTYAASVYGVAAAVLLPACLLTGASLGGYPARSWLAVAGVIVGPQLLGHTVFNSLLATVSASVVAVAILTEPVGATALAWLLFGEFPAPSFWVGAPLVLAGVWLATTTSTSRRM
jgi:drug/metabolite transporter (DMT)-like permease